MKLMILDGNSILNRAFYGVRILNAPDGTPTNAVFGFLNIFNRLMAEISPDAVAVAFDLKEKTFRHQKFDYYKAQRKPMPEELAVQLPLIKQVLKAMRVHIYTCPGFEADDILGTAGTICAASSSEGEKELNAQNFLNGVKRAIEDGSIAIENCEIDSDDIDCFVADKIIQYTLFGDIIYA